MANGPTIHASAVLIGAHAILIRGPAGSGKSQLALRLIEAAPHGPLLFSRLVADDRVHVATAHGRLIAWPARALAGLIEVRGLGIRRFPYEELAVVSLVVDLGVETARRLPGAEAEAIVEAIRLPRLAVAPGADAFALILAGLMSASAPVSGTPPA
jgi:serine kinase of HPr protein (carbohydrate metabolism regulator)